MPLGDQALALRLVADARKVQAGAIVAEGDQHLIAFLAELDADRAQLGLAGALALLGCLDAVHHAVAQQMLEGADQAFKHAAIQFDALALDLQIDLLAALARRLAHDAVQALADRFELHHPRAQQVVLQLAGQAALRGQLVFAGGHIALQRALHRGHVVDRLGQHARHFLEARVAVELERIEIGATGACRLLA